MAVTVRAASVRKVLGKRKFMGDTLLLHEFIGQFAGRSSRRKPNTKRIGVFAFLLSKIIVCKS